jgi:dCTP deaminase
MYLSDRDLEYAHTLGDLIIKPPPSEFGPSGFDLHLDTIEEARVWNIKGYEESRKDQPGRRLAIGTFDYKSFANQYAVPVPTRSGAGNDPLVYRNGDSVILRPGGFFLWQTKEVVGTPTAKARYICFLNGKSTRSRLGLVVHLTAPTIEAGWWGQVTLEIVNFGPFELELKEGDAVGQVVVAMISSPPREEKVSRGVDVGQKSVTAEGDKGRRRKKKDK